METNKALKIILEFAEGRMTAEQYWQHYKENKDLRKVIIEDPKRPDQSLNYFDPVKITERRIDPKTYRDSSALYTMVQNFLFRNGISYTPYEFYNERYRFLIQIQPSWLDIRSEDFLINIVSKAPENLSKTQRIKWCKDRIKELFRYDSRPPRWVQSPEWPISENGRPLVFREQSKDDIHSELVKFYFYDPDTGKETIVEQLY